MESKLNIFMTRAMVLLALSPLSCAGCNSGDVQLGRVTGQVTLDGNPLPGALVRFLPQPAGRSAQGITDQAGNYTLDYSSQNEGALVGKSKVMITTGSLEDRVRRSGEKIPKKYNDETELTAEVKRGKNRIDFDLKSQ